MNKSTELALIDLELAVAQLVCAAPHDSGDSRFERVEKAMAKVRAIRDSLDPPKRAIVDSVTGRGHFA